MAIGVTANIPENGSWCSRSIMDSTSILSMISVGSKNFNVWSQRDMNTLPILGNDCGTCTACCTVRGSEPWSGIVCPNRCDPEICKIL